MSQSFSKDSQPGEKSQQRPKLWFDSDMAPMSLSPGGLSFLPAHPDRRASTLMAFFNKMSKKQKDELEAIVMES